MTDQATTLITLAWQADSENHSTEARKHYLAAARQLVNAGAWLELSTVLGNLGMLGEGGKDGDVCHLAQALWLCLFVEVPVTNVIGLARATLDKLGPEHPALPPIAATTLWLVRQRAADHPDREALLSNALALLAQCAGVRNLSEAQIPDWFAQEGLDDPGRFIPATQKALIALVGDEEWLYDPVRFTQPG